MTHDLSGDAVQHRSGASAVALSDEDLVAYDALGTAVVCFESTNRWISFRGEKAADALNGLVTNDVAALQAGEVLYAAALSPKGKVAADMHVLRVDENTFLTSVSPAAAEGWLALARKYVNPRLAKVADETDGHVTWMLCGGGAAAVVAALTVASPSARVVRTPPVGESECFMVLSDSASGNTVHDQLVARNVVFGSAGLWEVLRVESGRPKWGVDMDEQTIPQEANLDTLNAISFSKGCYTGQETVARLHFRGHVNRQLRGLRAVEPLSRGTTLTDVNGKDVGDVRSVAVSPCYGAIALAMIRREVAIGDTVQLTVDGRQQAARVVALPFADG